MPQVKYIGGDISKVASDAIITAINSGEMWYGGIDGVIQRAAGNLFHNQARGKNLQDGQTVVARGNGGANSGAFQNVVFVVDDLKRQLREIVYNGLKAASDAGFKSVTLPTVRMGVMLGVVEKTPQEAITEMLTGVKNFIEENSETTLENITFVIYGEQKLVNQFQQLSFFE